MDDRGGKTEYRLSSVVRLLRMRIQISHLTNYRYDAPAASVIHMLRLTPRNHDGQYVARWRIDVSTDCRLDQHEDAFGNITHVFTADGPLTELAVAVEGEVETRDTQGIVRGVRSEERRVGKEGRSGWLRCFERKRVRAQEERCLLQRS